MPGRVNNRESAMSFSDSTGMNWQSDSIVSMGLTGAAIRQQNATVQKALNVLQREGVLKQKAQHKWGAVTTAMRFANRLKQRVKSRKAGIAQRRFSTGMATLSKPVNRHIRFSVTEDSGITKYLDADLMFQSSQTSGSSSCSDYSDSELDHLITKAESMHGKTHVQRAAMVLRRSKTMGTAPLKKRGRSKSKTPTCSPRGKSGYRQSKHSKKCKSILGDNKRKVVRKGRALKRQDTPKGWSDDNAALSTRSDSVSDQRKSRSTTNSKRKLRTKRKSRKQIMMSVVFPDFSTSIAMTPETSVMQVIHRLKQKFDNSNFKVKAAGVEINDKSWKISELTAPIVVHGRYRSGDIIVFSDTEMSSDDEDTMPVPRSRWSPKMFREGHSPCRSDYSHSPSRSCTVTVSANAETDTGNQTDMGNDTFLVLTPSPSPCTSDSEPTKSQTPSASEMSISVPTTEEPSHSAGEPRETHPSPKKRKSIEQAVEKLAKMQKATAEKKGKKRKSIEKRPSVRIQKRQAARISRSKGKSNKLSPPKRTTLRRAASASPQIRRRSPKKVAVSKTPQPTPKTPEIQPKLLKLSSRRSKSYDPTKKTNKEQHLRNAGFSKGWYSVVGPRGCVVRAEQALKSSLVTRLPKGCKVHVIEIHGNRMCVDLPQKGWVSFQSRSGGKILKFNGEKSSKIEKSADVSTEEKKSEPVILLESQKGEMVAPKVEVKSEPINQVSNFISGASEEMLRSCMKRLHKHNPSLLAKIVGQVCMDNFNNI